MQFSLTLQYGVVLGGIAYLNSTPKIRQAPRNLNFYTVHMYMYMYIVNKLGIIQLFAGSPPHPNCLMLLLGGVTFSEESPIIIINCDLILVCTVDLQTPEHRWYVQHHPSLHGNNSTQERQERNFSTQSVAIIYMILNLQVHAQASTVEPV